MTDAAPLLGGVARGVSVLPSDLTPAQLAAAPALPSLDLLVIDDLSDSEDDSFAAALSS